jgi:restriction system protein
MTVAEAAHRVLAEADEPLHYEEITRRILERGLWQPQTKTPAATVGAQIYTNLKKKGSASPFVGTGKGMFRSNKPVGQLGAATADKLANSAEPLSSHPAELAGIPVPNVRSGSASFTDAAESVLEQHAHRQPMHYREITELALRMGLISTQGLTPEATMRAQIGVEVQRQQQRGERPRFFRLPKGLVGLTRWKGSGDLQSQIERHNLAVRKALHERLMALQPTEFEVLVSGLLACLGFQTAVTKPSGDGGIDVRGTLVVGEVIRTRMAVQVKRWSKNVQTPTVQQVRGSLGAHEQGLIVTTSDFSAGARTEAARKDATPVALMNGEELLRLLMENEIGVRRTRQELFELVDTDDDC